MALEPGISETVATTLRLRSKVIKDNIKNNDPVLLSMEKYDGMRTESGGRSIVEEMFFDQNQTVKWYDGGEEFSTAFNPTITAAEYDWKQLGGALFIHGRDLRINSGQEGVIKLLASRMKALESTLENQLHTGVLSDGTGNGGKQITGLSTLVSKTPNTGIIGGINAATSTFWRNFKIQPTVDIAGGTVTSAANIREYYSRMIVGLTRGVDKPKVALAGNTHYISLNAAMQTFQMITDADLAKAGFNNIVYMGVPVVLGGGVSMTGAALVPADLTYFLNTSYLKLVEHKDAQLSPLEETPSINQDAIVQLMIWMGAMTLSNRRLQGVLFDT